MPFPTLDSRYARMVVLQHIMFCEQIRLKYAKYLVFFFHNVLTYIIHILIQEADPQSRPVVIIGADRSEISLDF